MTSAENKNKLDLTKSKRKKYLVKTSIVAALIAISPYIFYLYESFPNAEVWETRFFTFYSNYYSNVQIAMWVYMNKIVPLYLFIIWFFTCKHWWYHILLIPISMYAFQLFEAFNDEAGYVDEVEIFYLIPIMMIIIPLVYWIRIRLFDKLVYGIDLKAIERELDEYKEKERLEKLKKEEERKKRLSDIH
ncbi:hypothetical protein GWK08_09985 [Leptobacterium flavescens]|uniref:Uncharacterized protein n=1 Tax=Leptobacterium flavescens TaxID=472055 RepID=A0A6P0UPK8_9FLAO|nr:hypothetical protein [Leptobacterium flavescens]NER13769.1 hypothetical protein [Leptobacterium flavescens]